MIDDRFGGIVKNVAKKKWQGVQFHSSWILSIGAHLIHNLQCEPYYCIYFSEALQILSHYKYSSFLNYFFFFEHLISFKCLLFFIESIFFLVFKLEHHLNVFSEKQITQECCTRRIICQILFVVCPRWKFILLQSFNIFLITFPWQLSFSCCWCGDTCFTQNEKKNCQWH